MNKSSTNRDQQTTAQHLLRTSLLTSPEGHILLTGLSAALLYILWLVAINFHDLQRLQVFVAMTATHVLFGRAAGMSFGYTFNLAQSTIIVSSMIIESIVVLLFYPLFVFSWRHLLIIPTMKKMMDRIHNAAEAHRHLIHRYGLLGLFVFVWFPFWMTGALVGCVIGFLLELRPWLNIGVVIGGAYLAIISWAFLLNKLHDRVARFGSYAPLFILAGLIVIALIGHFINRARRSKEK